MQHQELSACLCRLASWSLRPTSQAAPGCQQARADVQVEAARAGEQRAEAEATELQAQLDLQAVLNGQLVAQLQDGEAELSQVSKLM